MKGFFSTLPSNSKVFARDIYGHPTLYMDCKTLDLLIAEVDAYTTLGGLTAGNNIITSQDIFWANTIVFMDKLQQPPTLFNISNNLSVSPVYNSYQWYNNGSPINGATTENFTPTENGVYYAEVTVNGGCKILSDSIIVNKDLSPCINNNIFETPNAFTPNNDNVNDEFCLQGWNNCIEDFIIQIYDRWGEKVFESKESNFCWDGKYNENILESQTLTYIITSKFKGKLETISKKGNITLLK